MPDLPGCRIFSSGLTAVPDLEVVGGPGPWTVLAPTDEAFASLPDRVVDQLLGQALPLTELLRSHLIRGVVPGAALAGRGWLLTLDGARLPVDALGEQILIDGALLVRPDLPLPFGVAHAVDRVLLRELRARERMA